MSEFSENFQLHAIVCELCGSMHHWILLMATVLSYFALQLIVKNDAPKDMKTVERSFLSLSEVRVTAVSCSQPTNGS